MLTPSSVGSCSSIELTDRLIIRGIIIASHVQVITPSTKDITPIRHEYDLPNSLYLLQRSGDFNDAFNPKDARKHPSYGNKPTPQFQRQMLHGQLEVPQKPVDERTYYEYAASAVPVVPTTYDTVI